MAEAPQGSLLAQAAEESRLLAAECADETQLAAARRPWAAQLQLAMQAAGVEFSLEGAAMPQPAAVRRTALQHHLDRVAAATQQPGASRLHHYFGVVRPECLAVDGYSRPAYINAVRERHRRIALTELRTGIHWGAEERDRLLGLQRRARGERHCTHCTALGLPGRVEDAHHIVFECELFTAGHLTSNLPRAFRRVCTEPNSVLSPGSLKGAGISMVSSMARGR